MANLLTAGLAYDPYFYANAALEQLNKNLGISWFVYRDYEDEKGMEPGSTIQLRRPGTFTAASMPIAEGSAADILPDYLNIVLDQWKGVLMQLTDKELTYTREKIINEHVGPAAVGVADAIDQDVFSLYNRVPHIVADDATTPTNDFPNVRKAMFDNKVPDSMRFFAIDGVLQNRYEKEAVFYQANTGVDGAALQRDGFLGRKFGFDIFASQNAPTHTAGSITATAGALTDGAVTKGATSIVIDDATSLSGTVKAGDVLTIGTAKYTATADATAAGNSITISLSPAARADIADGTSVTFTQTSATSIGLAAHRNAFALVMAPLSTIGNAVGARMATVSDPVSSLTLRSRLWYTGGSAKVFVGIDSLWGKQALNPDMAVRLEI